jgi:hypothetical protein
MIDPLSVVYDTGIGVEIPIMGHGTLTADKGFANVPPPR